MADTEAALHANEYRGPLVKPCVHCGRLAKTHFGKRLMCKAATGRLSYKPGAERHLYDVEGFPPTRTRPVEVTATIEVEGVTLTIPVRTWTEIPHRTSPHAGAKYVHLRFPNGNTPIDIAEMEKLNG